jgi:hypothetical protein
MASASVNHNCAIESKIAGGDRPLAATASAIARAIANKIDFLKHNK